MENYNRLFLLEDPGFDMDKWSAEGYESDEAMPKGNIQIATQLNAAYFGQPRLDKDALQHFHVPVKLNDGTWKADGTFADLLKAVYEGDNDVKDAGADAAAEHRSEISDMKIEDIIDGLKLTYIPNIATELELNELVPYVKSASSHKLHEAKQVGDGDRIEFGFGIAFPSDKERIMMTRNGVLVDGENYEIITTATGEGVAIKFINADGSDADAPVEGEVFAIYTEREVIEVSVIEQFVADSKAALESAISNSEQLVKDNEDKLAGLASGKATAAEALAKATAELAEAEENAKADLDGLTAAESMDKVASLKTSLATLRLEIDRASSDKTTNTFALDSANKDITASNNVISKNVEIMTAFIDGVKVMIDKANAQREAQLSLQKAVEKASDNGDAE